MGVFRLAELDSEELLLEKQAVSGLDFLERVGGTDKCPIHRYTFPEQDLDIRPPVEAMLSGGDKLGDIQEIDPARRWIDIKKQSRTAQLHPAAVYAFERIRTDALEGALLRLAEWVVARGMDAEGAYRAARDLLLRNNPRLANGRSSGPLKKEGEISGTAAERLALELDGGVLAIQGPPGSGKTYTGANLVRTLVDAGKRVGITATSHKVIWHLVRKTLESAKQHDETVECLRKISKKRPEPIEHLREVKSNSAVDKAVEKGDVDVIAGTAWLWARPEMEDSVDVLIVDEAGQFSLANALAVSGATRNLILLGDPRQLEQPLQGSHPEGADRSVLEHLLGGDAMTVSEEQGLFLEKTWRLHPEICRFNSELFYENRLSSREQCARQRLVGEGEFSGSGLRTVLLNHQGNQTSSLEEGEEVVEIYRALTQGTMSWIDDEGTKRLLTHDQVLIVAPYNAQVSLLGDRLPEARIGTVDKFQGQEAAVVIYSLTSSTPEDSPHGMGFLFSGNRLNVAVSRARCMSILVGSQALFQADCATPRQMRMANAFCRYLELSSKIPEAKEVAIITQKIGVGRKPPVTLTDQQREIVDRLGKSLEHVAQNYYRLILLVGPSGSGKTTLLQEVARRQGCTVLNVNLELSKRLLELTERRRPLRVRRVLDDLVGNQELAILDNIEILFDKSLKQEPLDLLQKLSRSQTILASWNGRIEGAKLLYARPDHHEYRKVPAQDFLWFECEAVT